MTREDAAIFEARCAALVDAVTRHSHTLGVALTKEAAEKVSPLVIWMSYLYRSVTEEHARPLLKGGQSAIIEALGCISLGLVRPAIFAMRTEIELIHSWMYFNDHPVEWDFAHQTGSKYPMLSQTRKYLSSYNRRFDERYNLLLRSKSRGMDNPYELLSIHVHAMTVGAMPSLHDLQSIVQGEALCRECVKLQQDVVNISPIRLRHGMPTDGRIFRAGSWMVSERDYRIRMCRICFDKVPVGQNPSGCWRCTLH
jgi:hypothetical protein